MRANKSGHLRHAISGHSMLLIGGASGIRHLSCLPGVARTSTFVVTCNAHAVESGRPHVVHTAPPAGRRTLGRGGPDVPLLCFGCMLFGEGTTYPEAERLLGMCADAGVAFFDTAEMYPVPQRAETQGASEEFLGRWLQAGSVRREDVLVASKVAGPSGQMTWLRGGPHRVDADNITQALDGTLRRLRTDYVDLYQIHWPDRYVPMFGDSEYDPSYAFEGAVPMEEQLEALGRAMEAGKVRYVGLSNETPWGLCKALTAASSPHQQQQQQQRAASAPAPLLPRVVSLQNAYSLTCRTFDSSGLAEVCHLEGVRLLAYSPLAMGLLTGKYLAPDGGPPGARLNRYRGRYAEAESRYGPRPSVTAAVAAYCALAAEAGMSPTSMALRFVLSRPMVASAVVGATGPEQLAELLAAAAVPTAADGGEWLPAAVVAGIEAIHERYPNPTP